VKTVANSTATGRMRNIFSGRSKTYDHATTAGLMPRPKYVSSLSVRSMTMTRIGKPSNVIRNTRLHSRSR